MASAIPTSFRISTELVVHFRQIYRTNETTNAVCCWRSLKPQVTNSRFMFWSVLYSVTVAVKVNSYRNYRNRTSLVNATYCVNDVKAIIIDDQVMQRRHYGGHFAALLTFYGEGLEFGLIRFD